MHKLAVAVLGAVALSAAVIGVAQTKPEDSIKYRRSAMYAIRISLTLRRQSRLLVKKKFFTNCWVSVEPPWRTRRAEKSTQAALTMRTRSMP